MAANCRVWWKSWTKLSKFVGVPSRFQREEISDSMLLEMLSAVQMCRNLERLVLHQDDWTPITDNLSSLPVVLVGTISKLEALIVLCITHPVADLVVETVREMLRTEVLPHRPAFWFHIGDDLPHAGNVDVPRVHLEEVIQPLPYFLAPPKSLHQYWNLSLDVYLDMW